jgi:hypothetical protein
MKKNIGSLKKHKEELTDHVTGACSSKSETSSQSSKAKPRSQSGKSKPGSQSGKGKTDSQSTTAKTSSSTDKGKTGKERKRMVIQEVDSEEESIPGNSV